MYDLSTKMIAEISTLGGLFLILITIKIFQCILKKHPNPELEEIIDEAEDLIEDVIEDYIKPPNRPP